MKLNAEQIKKALECCTEVGGCCECPYIKETEKACHMLLMEHSLTLVTSQEQRIKELGEESKMWEQFYECAASACRELRDKCDRLTEENENLHASCTELTRKCESLDEENERVKLEYAGFEAGAKHAVLFVKADTVRKMKERLQAYFGTYVLGYKIPLSEALKAVNQIEKEMLEESNERKD